MAIKRPDIYEHNNVDYAIADSNFVRGGIRTAVADLPALYALSVKVDQLKVHSTIVYVISESKYYKLIDLNNVGNSGGWGIFATGGSGGGITGATNGLSLVSGGTAVSLGGSLTGDTEISLNSKNLKILDELLGFDSGSGFNNTIYSIVAQSDGKILVGGEFTTYSGVTANYVIRLNNDGSIDSSFVTGSGFNGVVNSIVIQLNGKILVGGDFISYSGVTANRIIRLNSDGSIDTSFVGGAGFNDNVLSISIQSDGKILVGGNFTTYKGVTANHIIRLYSDGSVDNTFVSGTGFDSVVNSIAVQSDGKILVGGNFTTYKGVSANHIIRLYSDGSVDNTFVTGSGFNDNVFSISIQSDGKILVGGYFTTYKDVSANRIIRLYSDGSVDNTFVSGTGFDNGVFSIVIQSDGKILVGGNFTTYKDVSANRIIRLYSDGSSDSSFIYGTGFNYYVSSIAVQSDGKILVGGDFITYKGVSANKIIRLNSDGSINNVDENLNVAIFDKTGVNITGNLSVSDEANFSGLTKIYDSLSIQSGATLSILDNAGAGKVLTSDALGNITLQSPSGGSGGDKNNIYSYSVITDSCLLTTGSSYVILADHSTGITITLPSIPSNGLVFRIKDISGSASSNIITINGNGYGIENSRDVYINTDYGGLEIMYNGTAWYVLSFVN